MKRSPMDFIVAALAMTLFTADPATAQQPTPSGQTAAHTVVVELFTSQGCSSCPPADRLLSELGAGGRDRVVPLAFHVDFWNHAGWTDPFSKREWTDRQIAYSRALGVRNVYTPQAVIDGAAEIVGSDANGLRAAIATAEAKPAAAIVLRLQPAAANVFVEADVDLPEALRGRKWDLLLAMFETGLVTPVGRGENGGRTLQNDYVVRSLSRAGRVEGPSPLKATLRIQKEWDRAHLGVAAFLQDPRSLEIRGASVALLPVSEARGRF